MNTYFSMRVSRWAIPSQLNHRIKVRIEIEAHNKTPSLVTTNKHIFRYLFWWVGQGHPSEKYERQLG